MNKKELSKKVAEKANVTAAVAGECVTATFDVIKETVVNNTTIKALAITHNVSESAIKKDLSHIYSVLGITGKADLKALFPGQFGAPADSGSFQILLKREGFPGGDYAVVFVLIKAFGKLAVRIAAVDGVVPNPFQCLLALVVVGNFGRVFIPADRGTA